MKFIALAYLVIVLIGFTYSNLGTALKKTAHDPVALWTLLIIIATVVLLVAILAVGERRWRAAGLDIDGKRPAQGESRA